MSPTNKLGMLPWRTIMVILIMQKIEADSAILHGVKTLK